MSWQVAIFDRPDALARLPTASQRVMLISTGFDPAAKQQVVTPAVFQLTAHSRHLLAECVRLLEPGGLLFVYGLPQELPFWGVWLREMAGADGPMRFKYWIALDIDDAPRGEFLKPTHQGLLLFCKGRPGTSRRTAFPLDASVVRVPHAVCAACGLTLKDWGGKKHLMHPRGAALSDVWRDLPRLCLRDQVTPEPIQARVWALTRQAGGGFLHVIQPGPGLEVASTLSDAPEEADPLGTPHEIVSLEKLERNQIYQADCVAFLHRVAQLHPQGVFDLAFADPPYNLRKLYDRAPDALAEHRYLRWCNDWLDGLARTLKPGGSLLVLNLPQWALHHAVFLSQRLTFRHWIAWDAVSEPRGKLLPAHYALLYFTKPGATPMFNYASLGHPPAPDGEMVLPPDAPGYCLRAQCLRHRKRRGLDQKVELSDVWWDVHRIKHKRDRDAHPCQLPEKLLERIIRLTTHRGSLVFDPFGGTGTTALAAAKLGRDFVVVELSPGYVQIARQKLDALRAHADLFGQPIPPRPSVARKRPPGSKRAIELYLQHLGRQLGRLPTADDLQATAPEVLRQIDLLYPTRSAAFKRARIALRQ